MPRTSAAAKTVRPINAVERRVEPPATLPAPAKQLWVGIVNSLPGDRFHDSDRPLLALYCRYLALAESALENVDKAGATSEGKTTAWLRVADGAAKQCAVLASKLRLCPQTRMDRKVAGPAARVRGKLKPWDPI